MHAGKPRGAVHGELRGLLRRVFQVLLAEVARSLLNEGEGEGEEEGREGEERRKEGGEKRKREERGEREGKRRRRQSGEKTRKGEVSLVSLGLTL